jgi:Cu-Zn family superoxide dismutase
MKNIAGIIVVGAAAFVAACAQLQQVVGRQATAVVTINGPAGEPLGGGDLWQDTSGRVHVELRLQGLPPGVHAIHFHSVARCEGTSTPTFSSAGGHFNPLNKQHGLQNPAGPHAGDAPNFTVDNNGGATVNFVTDRVTLTAGALSLLDADGSSLVIHAQADDQVSQPSGNSGDRIACGVVRAVP